MNILSGFILVLIFLLGVWSEPGESRYLEAGTIGSVTIVNDALGNKGELVWGGARHYNGKLGRFVSADPYFVEQPEECVRSPLECGLFGYAGNNPVKYLDAVGMFKMSSQFRVNNPKSTKLFERGLGRMMETSSFERFLGLENKHLRAFKDSTGASKRQVQEAYTTGKGPTIKSATSKELNSMMKSAYPSVKDSDQFYGIYNSRTNTIHMNRNLLKAYETGKISGKELNYVVDHEVVHYLEDIRNLSNAGEQRSEKFEIEATGKVQFPAVDLRDPKGSK